MIEFKDVSMRYREFLDPSINDLECVIQPGMKVGIVGRTGAGKSTLLNVLFRLTDPFKGDVIIDDKDFKEVGLHMLRKNIAYIPQTPFLIQGSIRENLDPFKEFKEEEIINVLTDLRLMDHINKNCDDGIYTELSESSNLFSVGQK